MRNHRTPLVQDAVSGANPVGKILTNNQLNSQPTDAARQLWPTAAWASGDDASVEQTPDLGPTETENVGQDFFGVGAEHRSRLHRLSP